MPCHEPSGRRSPAAADDLLTAYLGAVYEVPGAAGTLRLVAGSHPDVVAPPWGRVHAVLTACNPGSVALDDHENGARQARLHAELDARGLHWRPAVNRAPGGGWLEPSCWITAIPSSLLDDLAGMFGQNASVTIADDGLCRLRIHRLHWLQPSVCDNRLQWPD